MSPQETQSTRNVIISGIFVLAAACITGIFVIVNTAFERGFIISGPTVQGGNPDTHPANNVTTTISQPTVTSQLPAPSTTTCSSASEYLGSGNNFSVTLQKGCHYHFNIACPGCLSNVENNYIIYYTGDSGDIISVTIPEGSAWQYDRQPNLEEVCEEQDYYPIELPPFLNVSGVQLLRICR
jgi:hypothetical protein